MRPESGAQFDLTGRRLLVTGAGRGLGRAIALGATACGAEVCAVDIDSEGLESLAAAAGIATAVVDVTDRDRLLAAAAEFGRLDGVVNNAMLIRYDPVESLDDAIVDRMVGIGVKGTLWGVQALLRQMDPAHGGVILNMASPTAERGFPGTSAYSMVKAAIGSMTRTLSAELGPRQIRVNALAPASIPTPGAVAITPLEEYERRAQRFPLRRIGREADAVQAALFLLSDAASFITGEILHVDGGFLASA
jgi:NAD(P)-dependent dehydrogenase (short-subunit alcohol dehydrogenase family)